MRRRALQWSSIVVAVLALLPGVAAAGGAAVQPGNSPTPLAGAENGYVPSDRLITVVPGCSAAREAAPSLALLFKLAAGSRVGLSPTDCYRAIGGQVTAQQSWTARGNSACAAAPQQAPDGRPKGTSNHGWGKAVDFGEPGGLGFRTRGYRFLQDTAWRVGWNHPGWAEPGGSACPEAWHWEWVGDGGTAAGAPVVADVVGALPGPGGVGRLLVTGLGATRPMDGAWSLGSVESVPLATVVVGTASTPGANGYWLVSADGGIYTFGDAPFKGSLGATRLNAPVVAMAATPTGQGYWLLTGDGGVFTFGDAPFLGSLGNVRLSSPVVAMAATPTGQGYWLLAGDGGVFTFGDASFHGSLGATRVNAPLLAMASTSTGRGYWLLSADGGLFTFGDAVFAGSGADGAASPAVALTRSPSGDGYWIVRADGTVLPKGG